jgi:hypothetical protein
MTGSDGAEQNDEQDFKRGSVAGALALHGACVGPLRCIHRCECAAASDFKIHAGDEVEIAVWKDPN